jgi:hypothetical protein
LFSRLEEDIRQFWTVFFAQGMLVSQKLKDPQHDLFGFPIPVAFFPAENVQEPI